MFDWSSGGQAAVDWGDTSSPQGHPPGSCWAWGAAVLLRGDPHPLPACLPAHPF